MSVSIGHGSSFHRSANNVLYTQMKGVQAIDTPNIKRKWHSNTEAGSGIEMGRPGMKTGNDVKVTFRYEPENFVELYQDFEKHYPTYYRICYSDGSKVTFTGYVVGFSDVLEIDGVISTAVSFKISGIPQVQSASGTILISGSFDTNDFTVAADGTANENIGEAEVPTNITYNWKLEESSGSTATDAQGNQNGVLLGTPQYSQTALTSETDRAIRFDSSDRLRADEPSFDTAAAHTITTWFNIPSGGAWGNTTIIQVDDPSIGNGFFNVHAMADGKLQVIYNSAGAMFTYSDLSTQTLSFDANYFMAFVMQADGTMQVYINGVLWVSATIARNTWNGQTYFEFPGNNRTTDVIYDDVKVFDSALTQDEIIAEYNDKL